MLRIGVVAVVVRLIAVWIRHNRVALARAEPIPAVRFFEDAPRPPRLRPAPAEVAGWDRIAPRLRVPRRFSPRQNTVF